MSMPDWYWRIRGEMRVGLRAAGQAANERGRGNEERVLRAAQALVARNGWLKAAGKGDRAQDARGIDIWVESDVGRLDLQVKSCEKSAARFRAKGGYGPALEVVIVDSGMSEAKLEDRVYWALVAARSRILALRESG